MAVVICVANQKGGVSKTTTATAMADILMQSDYKVLLVDTDPQCNATDTYRATTDDVATLYDVLIYHDPTIEAIQHTEVGDILPCDPFLMQADVQLASAPDKEHLLRMALEPVLDMYDYIIIDTPPSMGILLVNALVCSHGVVIPTTADRYTLQGLSQLGQTINKVRATLNPQLQILGLLRMKFNMRMKINIAANKAFSSAAADLGTTVFRTYIRDCVSARDAQVMKTQLSSYAPRSTVYKDYKEFVSELQEVIKEKVAV